MHKVGAGEATCTNACSCPFSYAPFCTLSLTTRHAAIANVVPLSVYEYPIDKTIFIADSISFESGSGNGRSALRFAAAKSSSAHPGLSNASMRSLNGGSGTAGLRRPCHCVKRRSGAPKRCRDVSVLRMCGTCAHFNCYRTGAAHDNTLDHAYA